MKSFQIATLFIALLFAIAHAIPNKISATRMFAQKIQVSHVSEHKDTRAGQALLKPHKQEAGAGPKNKPTQIMHRARVVWARLRQAAPTTSHE